jgi:hypothetical protein
MGRRVNRSKPLARSPLARTGSLTRNTGLAPGGQWSRTVPLLGTGRITASRAGNSPAAGSRKGRAETFPPDVAALIDARDPWCIHCGSPHDLQRHHRRIKGMGGDPRPHTDCACVGVRICRSCHEWAHSGDGRGEAEAEGLIIPRATVEPFTLSMLVHLEGDRGGMRKWPSCDGRWLDYMPGSEAA